MSRRPAPTESGWRSDEDLHHHREPWKPAPRLLHHQVAARALWNGTATEDQQQRFMQYLIEHVCRTGDEVYHSGSQRDTDFACGRRFVGNTIIRLITEPLLKETEDA